MAKNPKQMTWLYNENNCIACSGCESGYKQEFDLPVGISRRRGIIQEGGKYPNPVLSFPHQSSRASLLLSGPLQGHQG